MIQILQNECIFGVFWLKSIDFNRKLLGSQTSHRNEPVLFGILRARRFQKVQAHFCGWSVSRAICGQTSPSMSNLVYYQCHFEDFKQSNMPKMMCICIITSLQMYFGLLGTVWNAPKSPWPPWTYHGPTRVLQRTLYIEHYSGSVLICVLSMYTLATQQCIGMTSGQYRLL